MNDPYRPIAQSLPSGDKVNRWLLQQPRKKIVQLLKGQHVLDVACGTGSLTALLVEAGCAVTGVDSSPTMLAQAKGKGIVAKFEQLDAARLPYNHEFDAAVISIALHEMPPAVREQVWASMRRAVRPGGRLVVLDFAVPARSGFLSRTAANLIEQDERGTLNYHPEHYYNFQEFMRGGGLLGWVQKQGVPVDAEFRYLAGVLALVVIKE